MTADITIIANPNAPHQKAHQEALAAGLATFGISSLLVNHQNPQTKFVACWGWKIGRKLHERGHEVLVIERGYIGDRFKYTSLAWNGLNGYGEFPLYPNDEGKRFRAHGGVLQPWKDDTDGMYGLILGQVPGDASLRGKNLGFWYAKQAAMIRNHYKINAVFRPHPEAVKRGLHVPIRHTVSMGGDLEAAFHGARLAVCFNSNSGVDAILAGVPCVIADEGGMAYSMRSSSIDRLSRPDRRTWAYQLAYRQWEMHEIASGLALIPFAERIKACSGQ